MAVPEGKEKTRQATLGQSWIGNFTEEIGLHGHHAVLADMDSAGWFQAVGMDIDATPMSEFEAWERSQPGKPSKARRRLMRELSEWFVRGYRDGSGKGSKQPLEWPEFDWMFRRIRAVRRREREAWPRKRAV